MTAWALSGLRRSWRVGSWPSRRRRVALDGVELEVAPGERVGVIGPSGAGKSTLIRAGLGLIPADEGRISLFGEDTAGWGHRRWAAARHRVQVLFQDPRAMLHPDLPIGLWLEDSARLHRPGEDARRVAGQALADVGLEDRAAALPRELSGGERRRAGIARVLLARPELLVADEPTSGLDAALRTSMVDLLLRRAGDACAVVVVSHDVVAVSRSCHRVVVLDAGRVVESFRPAALGAGWRPAHRTTAALLEAAGWVPAGVTA